MSAEVVLFWFFSIIAIGSGIAMVLMRNVVHGALMLVLSFFGVAGLFLVLQSAFLAAIQVIVYTGAIMVLFLFVLMLLGVGRDDLLVARSGTARAVGWALALVFVVAVGVVFVGPFTGAESVCGVVREASQEPSTGVIRCAGLEAAIGEDGSVAFAAAPLFTRYVFAFEFVALLLVVATIAALVAGRRREPPETEDLAARTVPGTVGHFEAAGTATEPHGGEN